MNKVKYIGPEIKDDATLAELCGRTDHHLQVYISWEDATIDIDAVRDGDTSYTGSEYYGHAWSHAVDILSADDTRLLIKKLTPIVETMHAAHHSEWDGSNYRAEFDLPETEREDLIHAAERVITEARIDPVGGIWGAGEFCDKNPPEVTVDSDLEAMAAELQREAHANEIHLIDIEEYLDELLSEVG